MSDSDIRGAVSLAGLIDYQEGSVVSRTVVKKKTGNVTLFAFDNGEGLSEHTTPYEAMVFCPEGAAEITISGQAHKVTAGDMLILPANEPHAVRAAGRFKMLLIMIRSKE